MNAAIVREKANCVLQLAFPKMIAKLEDFVKII